MNIFKYHVFSDSHLIEEIQFKEIMNEHQYNT